ncbi:MAG: hypothetical protein FWE03_00275 [Firmicutes bacterium]|nr:hypothetical protein [Bacillota bacterium]
MANDVIEKAREEYRAIAMELATPATTPEMIETFVEQMMDVYLTHNAEEILKAEQGKMHGERVKAGKAFKRGGNQNG